MKKREDGTRDVDLPGQTWQYKVGSGVAAVALSADGQIEELLARLKEHNPVEYSRFEGQLKR